MSANEAMEQLAAGFVLASGEAQRRADRDYPWGDEQRASASTYRHCAKRILAVLAALKERRCATCRHASPHPNATAWRLCARIGGGAQIDGPESVGVRETWGCSEWTGAADSRETQGADAKSVQHGAEVIL